MKVISFLTIACTSLLTLSCSTITHEDCKKDMKTFGFNQGRYGLANLSDDIRKVCMKSDSSVDLEAYDLGFKMGWNEYCSPFHGYENGKKGDLYRSYCPPEKEELYREKFLIGKNVFEKNDQVNEIEEKIKKITPDAEHDLSAKEELRKMKDYQQKLNREIQSLEQAGINPVHVN